MNAVPETKFPSPEKLLPHRAPMVLVDRVTAFDLAAQTLTAETTVSEKSLFFDEKLGGVPACVAIEYMAQTVGCFAGLYDLSCTPPREPLVGFVLGTRKFDAKEAVLTPGKYEISARELFFDDEIASFACVLSRGNDGAALCSATLTAFRPRDLEKFKKEHL